MLQHLQFRYEPRLKAAAAAAAAAAVGVGVGVGVGVVVVVEAAVVVVVELLQQVQIFSVISVAAVEIKPRILRQATFILHSKR